MWIFVNKAGFFSAVENRDDPSMVIIRARCRQHAEALAAATGTEVLWTPDADYCCRINMCKVTWGEFLKSAGEGIDYSNVKCTLPAEDDEYHVAMVECWMAMNNFQGEREGVGMYVGSARRVNR